MIILIYTICNTGLKTLFCPKPADLSEVVFEFGFWVFQITPDPALKPTRFFLDYLRENISWTCSARTFQIYLRNNVSRKCSPFIFFEVFQILVKTQNYEQSAATERYLITLVLVKNWLTLFSKRLLSMLQENLQRILPKFCLQKNM